MPPDPPSSTDGAGRVWVIRKVRDAVFDTEQASIIGPATDTEWVVPEVSLAALRERTRVLEEALRQIAERAGFDATHSGRPLKFMECRQIAKDALAAVAVEDGDHEKDVLSTPGVAEALKEALDELPAVAVEDEQDEGNGPSVSAPAALGADVVALTEARTHFELASRESLIGVPVAARETLGHLRNAVGAILVALEGAGTLAAEPPHDPEGRTDG